MSQPSNIMDDSLKQQLDKIQKNALWIGIAALVLCGLGASQNLQQFFRSYLFGYLFWVGLTLGSLVLLALHHLVEGGWGFVIQRFLEASARTIPLMALLFIPFFFGMKELYIWARPEVVATDAILQHKSAYLNISFFWIRTAVYFLIWIVCIFLLTRWSQLQDESKDISLVDRIRKLSGPTILLYVITVTFASIDWVMSLEPHWFSTIFGFIFVIGQVLLTISFAIILLAFLSKHKPLSEVVKTQHYHDLGNLMLAFVMLWAYISLSQFMIIWSGNLPEEITWYLHRLHGGWQWVAIALVIFHFALPFIVLLSRRTKQNIQVLAKVAAAMIFIRLIDIFWIVIPNFHSERITLHWLDLVALIAIGGLWVTVFLGQLKGVNLLPVNDPRFKEAFDYE